MARWTIDQPTTRVLDGIVALRVRTVGGHVNILPTDDPASFEVSDIAGAAVSAVHEAGILTLTYDDLTGSGFLDRLKPVQLSGYKNVRQRSAAIGVRVPRDCPVEVTTASASIVAAGLTGRVQLRTASGDITADDLGGDVEVATVSGNLAARNVHGTLSFGTVSGQVAVAGGRLASFSGKSGSGAVLADIDLAAAARAKVATVAGEVVLRVPAGTAASVDLRSVTGTLDSQFSLDRDSVHGRSRMSGSTGSGIDPASVSVSTVSGAVSLQRRAADAPAAIPEGSAPGGTGGEPGGTGSGGSEKGEENTS